MNVTKFTEGEWFVDCEPCDQTATIVIKCGDYELMSVTPWTDDNPSLEESVFNAHVMSKAKKMYEMLSDISKSNCRCDEFYEEIVKLLAEARGEIE